MQFAVIGAGLAGLTAARRLQQEGHEVTVFERSRGVGGRTATRRAEELRFDHGAPALHDGAAPLDGAAPALARTRLLGAAGPVDLTVGAPTANAPAKALAEGLAITTSTRVGACTHTADGWLLFDDGAGALARVDGVVVTAPAPQAADLVAEAAPDLAARARTVRFSATWAAMYAWDASQRFPYSLISAAEGIAIAVAQSANPGRAWGERWVVHADPELTEARRAAAPADVAAELLDRFARAMGRADLPAPSFVAAHRWRYARPITPLSARCLVDDRGLVLAGDWCGGSTAGAAIRSGAAAANAVVAAVPVSARVRPERTAPRRPRTDDGAQAAS